MITMSIDQLLGVADLEQALIAYRQATEADLQAYETWRLGRDDAALSDDERAEMAARSDEMGERVREAGVALADACDAAFAEYERVTGHPLEPVAA